MPTSAAEAAASCADGGMKKRASSASTSDAITRYGAVFCDLEPSTPSLIPDSASSNKRRRIACSILCAFGLVTLVVVYNGVFHAPLSSPSQTPRPSIRVIPSTAMHHQASLITRLASELPVLQDPPVRRSANGELFTSLRVNTVRFNQGPIAFWTRAYEHSVPGPTLSVQPGDTLKIQLVNDLKPNIEGNWTINTYHQPNTTNLHVHGMHVDPTGLADNVFRAVEPGETSYTEIQIPLNHPRGLFHYHPHFHGSVFLQMGGMVGAIVVEDDPQQLSQEYYHMTKHLLIFQSFRFHGGLSTGLLKAANASRSRLDMNLTLSHRHAMLHARIRSVFGRDPAQNASAMTELSHYDDFYTINGQFLPKIELQPNENRLLRLLNAGATNALELSIPGCSIRLVAADGIYLPSPRLIQPALVLSPGSRADIVIRCTDDDEGQFGALRPIHSIRHHENNDMLGKKADVHEGILGFVHVTSPEIGDEPAQSTAIVTTCPQPPPALYADNDLRHLDPVNPPFLFEFTMGAKHEKDGFVYKDYLINHKLFDPVDRIELQLGQVYEWVIINRQDEFGKVTAKNHPFHLHTNAFQVVAMSHGHGVEYEIGDWRDVILVPTPGNVTIRFRPVDFTGLVVAHCHILGHSDGGMVAAVEIKE